MKRTDNKIVKNMIYLPLSAAYGAAVALRNKLYDLGVLKSEKVAVPTIGIGNITVGGTGKTPHAEYLIRLLKGSAAVCYLSRGYRRRSSGFVMAGEDADAKTLGDEAYQIHSKFPDIPVAVDEDRLHGIGELSRDRDDAVVILDDVYQHRRLHVGLNILLVDNNRLIYRDRMLPYGELRESFRNTDRADIIVITKCPETMQPVDCLSVRKQIAPFPYQKIYFTRYAYSEPVPLYSAPVVSLSGRNVLMVTAIARPDDLYAHLCGEAAGVERMTYDDHYSFSMSDMKNVERRLQAMPEDTVVIVTDKDKAKIVSLDVPESVRRRIYSIGIEVQFMFGGQEGFDRQVREYVAKALAAGRKNRGV